MGRDQRVYKQTVQGDGSFSEPQPVTAADTQHRFADAVADARLERLVAVREDHSGEGEAVNSVAAIGAPEICRMPASIYVPHIETCIPRQSSELFALLPLSTSPGLLQ